VCCVLPGLGFNKDSIIITNWKTSFSKRLGTMVLVEVVVVGGGDHDQNNTETMVDHQVGGWWRSGPPFLFAYSFLFFLDLVFFSGTSIHGVEVVGEWVGGRWGGRRCFSFVC